MKRAVGSLLSDPTQRQLEEIRARLTSKLLDEMIKSALNFCHLRSRISIHEIVEKLAADDKWTNSTFRYALAKEISNVVVRLHGVRDMYLYGSVMEDTARSRSGIEIILHVETEKAPCEELTAWLDSQLTARLCKLLRINDMKNLLNIHIVTDADIDRKEGYASLLLSMNTALTRLRDYPASDTEHA